MQRKWRYSFLTMALVAFLLAGCAANAPQSGAPSLPESGGAQQGVPENESSYPELETLVSLGQRFSSAGTEDGAYVRLTREDYSEVLTFIDYKAQVGVPLCSQANCAHSDDTCTAWLLSGWNNVFVWNGKLYVTSTSNTGDVLLEMDLNGQNRREVVRMESSTSFDTGAILGSEDALFFGVRVYDTETAEYRNEIRRLNPATGEMQKMYSRDGAASSSFAIMGACEDKIVIKYTDSVNLVQDLDNPDNPTVEIYCIDQTGAPVQGDTISYTQENKAIAYIGTCLYLADSAEGTITTYDLRSGSESAFQDDRLRSRSVYLYGGQQEGPNISVGRENSKEAPDWYLYHDGMLIPSQYAAFGELDSRVKNRVVADAGDSYLVQRDYNDSNPKFSLVAKEDYWADAGTDKDIPIQMQLPW